MSTTTLELSPADKITVLAVMKQKIYFAHPVSDYNQEREKVCLALVRSQFPDAEILNPNQEHHNTTYLTEGMSYFESLVKSCNILVAVPFKNGEWGMGVWREAETLARAGGTVFELNPETNVFRSVDFRDIRPLSINESKQRVKEEGHQK